MKRNKVHKYLFSYRYENGGGSIDIETKFKIKTFSHIAEIVKIIKRESKLDNVAISGIFYMGKGLKEINKGAKNE